MNNTSTRSAFAAGARTPEQILVFHRRAFGDARMEADVEQSAAKPEGVTDAEWDALGDPGKQALTRERERAEKAERDLAEARKPKPTPPPSAKAAETPKQDAPSGGDLAAQIADAVQAALAPMQEQQTQWQAEQLATRVRDAVTTSAAARFHDVTDVMPHLKLAELTDGAGSADADKITAELDRIASEKPHLVKPAYAPRAPLPGAPFGGGPSTTSIDDRVKESLSRMQKVAGARTLGTA